MNIALLVDGCFVVACAGFQLTAMKQSSHTAFLSHFTGFVTEMSTTQGQMLEQKVSTICNVKCVYSIYSCLSLAWRQLPVRS